MRRDRKEKGDVKCQICGGKLKFDLLFKKQKSTEFGYSA